MLQRVLHRVRRDLCQPPRRKAQAACVFGIILFWACCTLPGAKAYVPLYERFEQENISVYEQAAQAVVTINALVNGGPSSGAGVIIDPSGLIVTSSHVVGNAGQAYVSLSDGRKARAIVVGQMSDKTDLAILKVNVESPLPTIRLGDSSQVKVGQRVLAIGNPYGFERTLTTGIISRIDSTRNRLQTDAAINPGNSGGPLLDSQGYLIGINQSIYNPEGNRSNIGIGFAVPVNSVKIFLKRLAAQPVPSRVAWGQSAAVRHVPSSSRSGYENVSDILQRFSEMEGL
jgi:serine protease Do